MADIRALKERAGDCVNRLRPQAIEMASSIFDHPEASGGEVKTAAFLMDALRKHGFAVTAGVGGFPTAFRAELACSRDGPTVAFIAEYDALPNGHACHHHLIASGAVNCAIALSAMRADLPGKIVCIGTPAEEAEEAKIVMVRNGAFDGVDAALMFHGGSRNSTRLIVLAVDGLEFSYKGKAAHAAAAPHEGVNALDAVVLLFTSINALRQQLKDDVRIHGNVTEGGTSVSTIPERAVARFLIRSQKRNYLDAVTEKVRNCARGAALQTGAELTITSFLPDSGNDLLRLPALAKEYEDNFLALGGILDPEPFLLGSSDIGCLSYALPALHPMVKSAEAGCALHTEEFLGMGKSAMAFEGMIMGMKALSMTAVRCLADPAFLASVKSEHRELTVGK